MNWIVEWGFDFGRGFGVEGSLVFWKNNKVSVVGICRGVGMRLG